MVSSFCNHSLLAVAPIIEANNPTAWILFFVGALAALTGLLTFTYGTQGGVIARATTKEAIRQPIFILAMVGTIAFLVLNTFLPFFSLGRDLRMLEECGVTMILVCGLLIATWTASTSIAEEIEGKTAMTLLSKPITRRQFILGKYFGILQAIILFLIPIVIVFALLILYKIGYDAHEASKEKPAFLDRLPELLLMLPAVVLAFLEVAVLTAVSVAISTRLPFVVNMTVCFTVYLIGNLTPQLVHAGVIQMEAVAFMAQVIATVLPGLEWFNSNTAISTGVLIPPVYLGIAAIYAACYSGATILLAFILFEDRDLA